MRRPLTAVAALVAVAATAGCGGGEEARSASTAAPLGKESAGSVVQFADCGDWRSGSREERFATVEVLRGQLTPQRSKSASSPLADERAYEMLDNVCSADYAGSLRLYKLYVKMQGFAPLNE